MASLPPLQSLRALEAAVRLRSYSRAGDELGLTHGAISHRIRELEARTGRTLFRRAGNAMEPTDEARRLVGRVREALAILHAAFPAADAGRARRTIRVSVLPSFASRWLVPRLHGFRATHPDVAVELDARLDHAPVGAGGVDAAIRYGPGGWPRLRVERLAEETLFPVCSPAYRDRLRLARPADLRRAVLLRHTWQPWAPWLRAVGLAMREPEVGPAYADAGLLIDAAVAGEGVALARGLLAGADLAAGRLVTLWEPGVRDGQAYHLVRPAEPSASDGAVDAFRDWIAPILRAEVHATLSSAPSPCQLS